MGAEQNLKGMIGFLSDYPNPNDMGFNVFNEAKKRACLSL
jgi:hypothetical protein